MASHAPDTVGSLHRLRSNDSPISVEVAIIGYNYGRFISDAIESALAQELDQRYSLSVTVTDDGSTDETPIVVQTFSGKIGYSRIPNSGVSAARNHAVERSDAEFIAFLDADDRLPSTYLQKCLAWLSSHEGDFTFTNCQYFGERSERLDYSNFASAKMRQRNVLPLSCVFPRQLLRAIPFDAQLREGLEDYDLFLRLLHRGKRPLFVPDTFLLYRAHGSSRTDQLAREQHANERVKRRIALKNWRFMGSAWTIRWLTMPIRLRLRDRFRSQPCGETRRQVRKLRNEPSSKSD